MSKDTKKYGILVAVDGSAESDAAVRWAAREAVMRDAPCHPRARHHAGRCRLARRVVAGSFNEWQEQNARQVIEQAQKTLHASLGDAEPPAVRTEVLHSTVAAALVNASKERADGRGRQSGHGRDRSRHAGFGQQRFGPPCALPGRDRPRRRSPEPDHTSPVLLGIDGSPASEAATGWRSMKRHVEGSTLSRCTRGAMSVSSRSSAWTGTSTKTRVTKCWRTPGGLAGTVSRRERAAADRV